MAYSEMSYALRQAATQHVIMFSVVLTCKHTRDGPTNTGQACTDILIFALYEKPLNQHI
jgi:hypothetical protein